MFIGVRYCPIVSYARIDLVARAPVQRERWADDAGSRWVAAVTVRDKNKKIEKVDFRRSVCNIRMYSARTTPHVSVHPSIPPVSDR